MRKIILVGNSQSLLQQELGKVIDSYKHVARFNNFEITGFEKHCGSRTTTWVRQAGARVVNRKFKDDIVVFLTYCRWMDSLKSNMKKLRKIYPKATVVLEDFSKTVGKELSLEQPDRTWPSIGLLAIKYYIKLGYDVTICGFSFNDDHYYKYNGDSNGHNWAVEAAHVHALAASKRVTIM